MNKIKDSHVELARLQLKRSVVVLNSASKLHSRRNPDTLMQLPLNSTACVEMLC